MKKLRLLTIAGVLACCVLLFGSQTNTFGQGRSGKSKGNSNMGERRSTDAIRRGIDRIYSNRSVRNRNNDQDRDDYRRMGKSKNKKHGMRTNNGVRDHGRGIGRGKGQGKGRGYAKRVIRGRNN